jgi:hypothetical protein
MMYDDIIYDIYVTAIGVTPGGNNKAHIYTQSTGNGTYEYI